MAIQAINFTGHKDHKSNKHSAMDDVLNVGLKGGAAAAAGYAVGKYVIPVGDEFVEMAMAKTLEAPFEAENRLKQQKAKKRSSRKNEEASHQTKTSASKAKNPIYKDTKVKLEKELEQQKKAFNLYLDKFYAKKGGKEACMKEMKKHVKTCVGVGIAVIAGGIFTFAALVDQSVKARQRNCNQ